MALHSALMLKDWDEYLAIISREPPAPVLATSHGLSFAETLAVARNGVQVEITDEARLDLSKSTKAIEASIKNGETIYGVNTGFGGSADTRTSKVEELQRVLLRELHYGILPSHNDAMFDTHHQDCQSRSHYHRLIRNTLPCEDLEATTCMPDAWTRATILIRVNSLISGHSGIRSVIIDRMLDLLNFDIVPRVPMRGSISASGDLSPLSYIGGVILGKPTLQVSIGPRHARKRVTAREALSLHNITPESLAMKETLAIVNGTATSCAVAVLALHDANMLAILSQVLTAMSVESLNGTSESFDPFFAQVRPHPGQVDAAQNILKFLAGSQLIADSQTEAGALRQDRYSIRTAAQWIGPVLEDLQLARQQLSIEMNSVTDNPIINDEGRSLHGGNFQARAVTSAMEKTRQGLQTIGRMLFSQCSELIDPASNKGLPPNLVLDQPSLSYIMKGIDIQSAALVSELGFLANPVGSHVQTAEMRNQSLNSLALISARYTHVANEVLSMLAAGHVLAVCQAIEIRAMNMQFFEALRPALTKVTNEILFDSMTDLPESTAILHDALQVQLRKAFDSTTTMDSDARFEAIGNTLRAFLLLDASVTSQAGAIMRLSCWRERVITIMRNTYDDVRERFLLEGGDADQVVGMASKKILSFVRQELQVPFLHTGVLKTPNNEVTNGVKVNGNSPATLHAPEAKDLVTVGSYMTRIHQAIRNGTMFAVVMDCVREAQ